jgi:hypothetical protein
MFRKDYYLNIFLKQQRKEEVKPELFDKIFEYELDVINKFNGT